MTDSRTSSLPPFLLARPMEHTDDGPTVRALTTALARGDDEAWLAFHRQYGPALFRLLLAITRGDHALAADALQETYLRIARHVRTCDAEAMFESWIRVVARTALADLRRKQRRLWDLVRRSAELDSESLEDLARESQLSQALDAALAELPADERLLLERKYLHGRDVRSIADELGISAKATESRLTRARAGLRERLKRHLPTDEANK